MIWKLIRNKTDLLVVCLDLTNAYGSIPRQLLTFALKCHNFHITSYPKHSKWLFQELTFLLHNPWHLCKLVPGGWLTMGGSICPILFTAALEVLLKASKQVVWGVKVQSGQRLSALRQCNWAERRCPVLRSYMNGVTTLLQTDVCISSLLKRLKEFLSCSGLKANQPNPKSHLLLSEW